MKTMSQRAGIEKLAVIRDEFRCEISAYEINAKPCSTCATPGSCCLDEHFVNVSISRIEAAAIGDAVNKLPADVAEKVYARADAAIERSRLDLNSDAAYSCPLFERGNGCLVHHSAKPLPCIIHACYERKEDLPPVELLWRREVEIDRLNHRVYRRSGLPVPIPIAIRAVRKPV